MSALRIVAAAIKVDGLVLHDGTTTSIILSQPPPARHCHLIWAAQALGYESKLSGDAQAFMTSEGLFVDRVEAARIAIEAGQIEALKWPPNLYSEDLW